MSSDLQIICDGLLRAPYHRNISLPQLQSQITSLQLIQLIHRVLNEIDKENPQSMHRIELKAELPEETVERFMHALVIFAFKIPDEERLREALLEGDRQTLLRVLAYLLSKETFLKKRAYLARFLTPVDVPVEFLQDEGMAAMTEDLKERQSAFKELHREVEAQKKRASTANLKRNLQLMEDEKQNLLAKIAKNEKRLESIPDSERWMAAARALREAKEVNEEYTLSIGDLSTVEGSLQEELQSVQKTLRECRLAARQTPEQAVNQLDEDVTAQRFMVEQKMPEQLKEEKQKLEEALWVAQAPVKDTEAKAKVSRAQVKDLQQEIDGLNHQKMALQRSRADDKLAVLRTQAAGVTTKKQAAADELARLQAQYSALHGDIESKESRFVTPSGIKILRGEEFKKFVIEVRDRSYVYKRMKQELAENTKELEIAENTLRILELRAGLKRPESGASREEEMQQMESERAALRETLDARKKELAPTIQHLKELRQKHAALNAKIAERRKAHDDALSQLDSTKLKRIQETKKLQGEINEDESRAYEVALRSALIEVEVERAAEELRSFTTEASAKTQKSWKDVYSRRIQENEHLTPKLHAEQQQLKTSLGSRKRQLQLFDDLKRFLELKMAHNAATLKQQLSAKGPTAQQTNDRLVL